MTISCKKIIILVAVALFYFNVKAQLNVPKYEMGAMIGGYVYQGDLTPEPAGSFRTMTPGISVYGSRLLNRSFSVRANLAFSVLRGDDAAYEHPEFRQHRNFNFHSPVAELSGLVVWNPMGRNYIDKGFSPYIFGGAGVSLINVKKDWSNYDASYFGGDGSTIPERVAIDYAHGTPHVIPVFPVGVGLRYNISSRWALNVESSYRFMFTDYLDGFSQSADPSQNDHYHSTSIGIIYRIGKKNTMDCPTVF